MKTIPEQLHLVRQQIAEAESTAGRPGGSVRLLAVSKTFPISDIATALSCGQQCFGENRVQELLLKVPALDPSVEWHLIGQLQSNKVAKAVPLVSWIHSVDSEKLLSRISRSAVERRKIVNVLLEVNSGEDNKSGFRSDFDLCVTLEKGLSLPGIHIKGFMTMAPFGSSSPELHRIFSNLRDKRDRLSSQFGQLFPELSMGMSSDFREAIAEGSTIVRIGTSIFGGRS